MSNAGREAPRVDVEEGSNVEHIATNYLVECGGDPQRALRRVILDALADLVEIERRSRRHERLISRGYVGAVLVDGSER